MHRLIFFIEGWKFFPSKHLKSPFDVEFIVQLRLKPLIYRKSVDTVAQNDPNKHNRVRSSVLNFIVHRKPNRLSGEIVPPEVVKVRVVRKGPARTDRPIAQVGARGLGLNRSVGVPPRMIDV